MWKLNAGISKSSPSEQIFKKFKEVTSDGIITKVSLKYQKYNMKIPIESKSCIFFKAQFETCPNLVLLKKTKFYLIEIKI